MGSDLVRDPGGVRGAVLGAGGVADGRLRAWSFTIPGQPPSWNNLYEIATKYRHNQRLGVAVPYPTLVKTQRAADYQDGAILIIRSACPSRWKPTGDISVIWRLYLSKWIDCDNTMKVVHDAMAIATGVDDKWFIPCVQERRVGLSASQARVEIDVRPLA